MKFDQKTQQNLSNNYSIRIKYANQRKQLIKCVVIDIIRQLILQELMYEQMNKEVLDRVSARIVEIAKQQPCIKMFIDGQELDDIIAAIHITKDYQVVYDVKLVFPQVQYIDITFNISS